MHQNDVFLFFKNYFLNQRIKTIQNTQKNLEKINYFFKERDLHRVPKRYPSKL
jgi:hypothetical protein